MSKRFCFGKISEIDVENRSSWDEEKIFLTFDIDWAHDDIIRDCQQLVEITGISATFFITHNTPVIDELRIQPQFELGLHPNFNHILEGNENTSAEEVLHRLKSVVPEATSVRSHSTTFSSKICALFMENGLTHDSNYFIPDFSEISLKPWKNWIGVTMVPYLWEDDVACLDDSVAPVLSVVERSGLRVFDFHPIHVFLNSESLDRYNQTKELHHNPTELVKHRYEGYGTRNRLLELLGLGK